MVKSRETKVGMISTNSSVHNLLHIFLHSTCIICVCVCVVYYTKLFYAIIPTLFSLLFAALLLKGWPQALSSLVHMV